MKKSFKKYAKYLRENHLEELAVRNLEISKTMDIPLMRLFNHLTDKQILEMSIPSLDTFLKSIEDDTFWEKTEDTYTQLKEDKLKDISKNDIHPSDIVLINAVRKKGFLSFVPSYSYDINEISELMSEMDDFFRESDRRGMEVIYFIQKETEARYKESEERYRDLFENANDLIHIVNPDGVLLYANRAWLSTLGYTILDLPRLTIHDIVHPDYKELHKEERKRVMAGKQPRDFEFAVISSTGKKIYLGGNISCQFVDGKVITTRGIFTNITTRKINEERLRIYTKNLIESEERYRLILENVKDYAIILVSPEGIVMSWNKGAENIEGYTSKEIIGKHISIFYPLDVPAEEGSDYILARAKENGRYQTENLRIKKDGSKFWANILLTALHDDQGNLKGFVKITRDITERKQAEDLIKASQNKLQAIFDHAPDAVIVTDTDNKIIGWNRAAEKMYGISIDEALGKSGDELFKFEISPPDNVELARQAMKEKGTWEGEATIESKGGEKIVVIASATTLYDENKKPTGVLAINKDITERKKADESIAKTLQLLNEAEQMAHFGSWEINVNTNKVIWSDELYRIYGLKPDNTESLWKIFFKYIHPEDKEHAVKAAEKAMKDLKPVSVNYRIINDNGEVRSLIAHCSVITNVSGTELKLTGTVQDITEQKEKDDQIAKSLRQLNEAQRMAHIGSWEWDVISNTILWSDELYNIYGIQPDGTAPNYESFLSFVHPDDREKVDSIIVKAFEDKQPFHFDHRVLRNDGSIRILNSHGVVTVNANGEVIKMSGTGQDITERVLSSEELKKAEDTVKAKQQFLSNMSHEIRTPLNSIIGFTKVVLKSNLNPKQREYLDAIKLSGQTLLVLINDILDLAKVDSGKMIFEKIPFKLSSSVSAMLHLFDTKVQEKNIKLINEFDPRIPEVLIGDPVRFHQIILNLVSNSIKFTHVGSITMKSKLIKAEGDEALLEFSVIDTGIGIEADKMDTIFENFQQATSTTGRLYGGTGLGLAIVKQLVTYQGGTISVKSKVNQGTTFTFRLSFKTPGINQPVIVDEEETTQIPAVKNAKVLVVEDVVLNQLLMKAILDDFGFEYDVAENGKVALEKLKDERYDIVLMDLQMPIMNGFETTEIIRQQMAAPVNDIPIIALTADVTTVDLEKCIAIGMNDYVTKPIDEKLLLNKINKWIKTPVKTEEVIVESKNERSAKQRSINLDYLKNKVKGNTDLMKEMIMVYLEQTPMLLKKMREGLEQKDWDTLHKAAHRMIPSFSMVGIDSQFEAMAKKIQDYSANKEKADEIHSLLLQIEDMCLQACRELEAEYYTLINATDV